MCIFHSKFCCSFIHVTDKFLLTPANMFCHRYTGIISGSDYDTFNQRFYCLGFAFFKKYLRTTHGFRIGTGSDNIIQFQISLFQRIKDQNQCHDLCNTGRASPCIRILLINNSSGLCLHQYSGWRLDQIGRFRLLSAVLLCGFICRFILPSGSQWRQKYRKRNNPYTYHRNPLFCHNFSPAYLFYFIIKTVL